MTANIKIVRSLANFFLDIVRHGLFFLVFSSCIYILYLVTDVSALATNADMVQLPTMLLDFKSNPSNLWGWKLPDAPYYFPDTLVFFSVGFLVNNSLLTIIIYSLIQNYLLFWSLRWLYYELGGKKLLIYDLCFLLALLLFTAYHISDLSSFPNITGVYLIYLLSYTHFGAYIASIFSLATWFYYLHTNNFKVLIIGALIVFLTTASDFLLIIYFTLPLLIVMGVSFKLKLINKARLKISASVFIISSAFAYIFNKTIDPWSSKLKLQLDWTNIGNSLAMFADDILQKMTYSEKLLILSLVIIPLTYCLFSLGSEFKSIKQNNLLESNQINKEIFCLKLFILLAAVINLISVLGLGKYIDWGSMRYFLPIYYSPLIFSLLLLSLSLEKLHKQFLKIIQTGLIIIISAISFILTSSLEIKPATEILPPPNYMACFHRNAIAGLAGYWESKPIILFSHRKVQIATVTDTGEPYYWNNNRYWYEDSWIKPGNKPQFQFIFMRSLKTEKILHKYGQPDRIESCADSEIWWYNNSKQVYSKLMEKS